MPKVVDYAIRFECIREAVYDIVLRDGVAAISLAAVAEELSMSESILRRLMASATDLPELGMQWVQRREVTRWRSKDHQLRGTSPAIEGANALLALLPSTDETCADARARRLLLRGFPASGWARSATAEDQRVLAVLVELAVPPDLDEERRAFESARLTALVIGAREAACTGEITPEDAVSMVRRHLCEQFAAWLGEQPGAAA